MHRHQRLLAVNKKHRELRTTQKLNMQQHKMSLDEERASRKKWHELNMQKFALLKEDYMSEEYALKRKREKEDEVSSCK